MKVNAVVKPADSVLTRTDVVSMFPYSTSGKSSMHIYSGDTLFEQQ